MTTKFVAGGLLAAVAVLGSSTALAVPYQVHMDNVLNLANWATVDDGIGDLYDGSNVKQVDVTYTLRTGFGNTANAGGDPQFWQSLEYGNNHRAIFGPDGGSDVLEVEITGLNGNQVSISQSILGRWYPDGINTLGSDWRLYDSSWNLLTSGTTVMTDFVDYPLNFAFGSYSSLRFQLGHDNWDNGIIAFTYHADVLGTLDLSLDRQDAPSPGLPGSGAVPVPEPTTLALMLGAMGLGAVCRRQQRRSAAKRA